MFDTGKLKLYEALSKINKTGNGAFFFVPKRGFEISSFSYSMNSLDENLFALEGGGDGRETHQSERSFLEIPFFQTQVPLYIRESFESFLSFSNKNVLISFRLMLSETKTGRQFDEEITIFWSLKDYSRHRSPLVLRPNLLEINEISNMFLLYKVLASSKRMRKINCLKGFWYLNFSKKLKLISEKSNILRHFLYIEILGLRGFARLEKLDLAVPNGSLGSGLTVVVGANNMGKSTVWEAFDSIARSNNNGESFSFSESRRNKLSEDGVKIKLFMDDEIYFQVSSINKNNSEVKTETNDLKERDNIVDRITVVPSKRQFSPSFGRGNANKNWFLGRSEQSRTTLRDEFTGRLFSIRRDEEKFARFNGLLREVVGFPITWDIDQHESGNYYLKFTQGDGNYHSSDGVGEGIISLFFLLDALHDSQPGALIVIDEPELSLHPLYIRRLSNLLSKYSKDRQIVIFTHSPILVKWEDFESGAKVARVFKENSRSIIAQPTADTLKEFIKKNKDDVNNPHPLGLESIETFFLEDRIILVEGQEDKIHYSRIIKQLGLELKGEIHGWGVGGAQKAKFLVKLLLELGFEKIAIIFDGDSNTKTTGEELLEIFEEKILVKHIPASDIRIKTNKQGNQTEHSSLLDENNQLRPEYRTALTEIFDSINQYFE